MTDGASSASTLSVRGSVVAIITPMFEDGSLDLDSLRSLIDWHLAQGTNGIVVVGTSGESPTVSVDEHVLLIQTVVQHVAARAPVIAGAGANSTAEAIELTQYAKQVGADATLQVVPYYNKPTQEGIFRHFEKIANSVDLPMILYNVPGRTVTDMHNETVLRLAQVPGIIGVKDARGDFGQGMQLIKYKPEHFSVYSGDDLTAVGLMLMGGDGNISVTANVAPRAMSHLCSAALTGDIKTAKDIHLKLLSLHRHLFIESNPIPTKWALTQLRKIQNGIRLPLTPLSTQHHQTVRAALKEAGLFSKTSETSEISKTESREPGCG